MIRLIALTCIVFVFQSQTSLPVIEITSVDMSILTRQRVECSNFDESFAGKKKVRPLKDRNKVDSFLNELNNLTRIDSTKTDTDTRAQILIKYPDRTEKICADKFSICRDGTCYTITEKLREIIW